MNKQESTGRSLRIENSVEELLVEGDQIKLKGNIVVNKNFDGESSLAKDKNGSILGYNSAVSSPNKKVLPRGSLVTNILGADLEVKDVGPAIQLYEFCNSFGEVIEPTTLLIAWRHMSYYDNILLAYTDS